jgi:hypothetical protein
LSKYILREVKMRIALQEKTAKKILVDLLTGDHENEVRVGFLVGQINGSGDLEIERVLVPRQESKSSESKIYDASVTEITRARKKGDAIIGHVVYHPLPGIPFESAIDEEQNYFSKTAIYWPNIRLVFNSKLQHKLFVPNLGRYS